MYARARIQKKPNWKFWRKERVNIFAYFLFVQRLRFVLLFILFFFSFRFSFARDAMDDAYTWIERKEKLSTFSSSIQFSENFSFVLNIEFSLSLHVLRHKKAVFTCVFFRYVVGKCESVFVWIWLSSFCVCVRAFSIQFSLSSNHFFMPLSLKCANMRMKIGYRFYLFVYKFPHIFFKGFVVHSLIVFSTRLWCHRHTEETQIFHSEWKINIENNHWDRPYVNHIAAVYKVADAEDEKTTKRRRRRSWKHRCRRWRSESWWHVEARVNLPLLTLGIDFITKMSRLLCNLTESKRNTWTRGRQISAKRRRKIFEYFPRWEIRVFFVYRKEFSSISGS